eukprot:360866_1
MAQANDDPPALVLNDDSSPESGWEMDVNFREWTADVILQYLSHLDEDEDFRDKYEQIFTMHNITGIDFSRNKLGNEEWCRDKLNMTTSNHAKQFSDIVRQRITANDNLNMHPPPQQPIVSLDDLELSPHAKQQIEPPNVNINNGNVNNNIILPPMRQPRINGGVIQPNPLPDDEKEPKPAFHFATPGNGAPLKTQIIGEPMEPQSSWEASLDNLPDQIQRRVSLEQAEAVVKRALSSIQPSKPAVMAQGHWGGGSLSHDPFVNHDVQPNNEPPPDMPFVSHPKPSMDSMSNKFRAKGPNKIMYPPKNGPIANAKRLGISIGDLPEYDPHDEIYGDPALSQNIMLKYAQELSQLTAMGYTDQNRNLRHLLRLGNSEDLLMQVIDAYVTPPAYESIYIGDRVVRGSDWKWGDQDGGNGLEGTVRGLRQWHPQDARNITTEAVVLWDHGLYGNYRFGYKSAFDLKVIDRQIDEKQNENDKSDASIRVGDRVCRRQMNWRWGEQDGGPNYVGTVLELYASPAPFEGGCRVAVLWDHATQMWRDKAQQYAKTHPNGDDEWYTYEEEEEDDKKQKHMNEPGTQQNARQVLVQFKRMNDNPHCVRKKRKKYVEAKKKKGAHRYGVEYESEEEHSSEWDEPDFEEILSKPVAKYRWQLEDRKSAYGVASDLEIVETKAMAERDFLMIDDRVRTSMHFEAKRKAPKSEHGIVLKVEQADATRVHPNQIKGDKVYTTWSSYQWYKFKADDGRDDVMFYKRGQVFQDKWSRIKVGDRVRRGLTWKNEYGMEDGGHERKGTVVCIQYVLQCVGILAKVRWDKTAHVNFYSW